MSVFFVGTLRHRVSVYLWRLVGAGCSHSSGYSRFSSAELFSVLRVLFFFSTSTVRLTCTVVCTFIVFLELSNWGNGVGGCYGSSLLRRNRSTNQPLGQWYEDAQYNTCKAYCIYLMYVRYCTPSVVSTVTVTMVHVESIQRYSISSHMDACALFAFNLQSSFSLLNLLSLQYSGSGTLPFRKQSFSLQHVQYCI